MTAPYSYLDVTNDENNNLIIYGSIFVLVLRASLFDVGVWIEKIYCRSNTCMYCIMGVWVTFRF